MADLAVETAQTVLPTQAEDQLKTLIDDFVLDLEISRRSRHTIPFPSALFIAYWEQKPITYA